MRSIHILCIGSRASASRCFAPSTSPVLGPAQAGNHIGPVPTMLNESAARAGVTGDLDDENTGNMDVDLR